MKKLYDTQFPEFLETLTRTCLKDDWKFLSGDTISIYDCVVGGFFANMVENPKSRTHADMKRIFDEKAPDRLKKYVSDFYAEMKVYLDARPEATM